jgi:hypothetical protein
MVLLPSGLIPAGCIGAISSVVGNSLFGQGMSGAGNLFFRQRIENAESPDIFR